MIDAAMSLAGKRVIVIGGSSGIGFAIATLSRELDAEVVIASSNATHVDAAVGRLSGTTGEIVDLRDEASVVRLFDKLGAFDHLVITAGDLGVAMFVATRDLDLAAALDGSAVRFWGALAVVKHGSRTIADLLGMGTHEGHGHRNTSGCHTGNCTFHHRVTWPFFALSKDILHIFAC